MRRRPRLPPPSAVAKHSGKKPFQKVVVAAIVAVVVVALVSFAAVNLLAPKDFNGTVTVVKQGGESKGGSFRATIKDDNVIVENLDSEGEVDNTMSFDATIAARSETENTYIFTLKDAKWMTGDELIGNGDWDSGDNKLTLFIPKGLKSQNPEGFFGVTMLNMLKDGRYGFATNGYGGMNLMKFDPNGAGKSLGVAAYMNSTEEISKIDPTSDTYDEEYGSPDTGKIEDSFAWEKREDGVHVTWDDPSTFYDAVDISVTE